MPGPAIAFHPKETIRRFLNAKKLGASLIAQWFIGLRQRTKQKTALLYPVTDPTSAVR